MTNCKPCTYVGWSTMFSLFQSGGPNVPGIIRVVANVQHLLKLKSEQARLFD